MIVLAKTLRLNDGRLVELTIVTRASSFLRLFADQAASAIANARAFSQLARVSARIRETERELRLLIDSLPQSVGAIGADGHVYYINKAGLQYLGRSLDEVTAAEDQLAIVYSPEDLEAARATIGDALARAVASRAPKSRLPKSP